MTNFIPLIRELCAFRTGVTTPGNDQLFARLQRELPFNLHRYRSGTSFNGWVVPDCWSVERAVIAREGTVVYDAAAHPLGVAMYSRSFQGDLDLEALQAHLVTNPALPDACVYHCMWQYRPWDADWAISVPHDLYRTLSPGRYRVDLVTRREPGDMLVATCEHAGRSPQVIVFNAHTCHPGQANDDMAGVVVLVRLFQWLQTQGTQYSYRLVLGPEHLGTVFYLSDRTSEDLDRMVCGAFAEMPGTTGRVKVASTFLVAQPIDRALRHAARHQASESVFVPWRQGAGNDETVWEAPGYEVPFVEISRCLDMLAPYPEYHSSRDTADLMNDEKLREFFDVLQAAVRIVERNATVRRLFDGLICLSNPKYGLYRERPDPAVAKDLEADSEKWGYLLDCLLRYFDGSITILDIADQHQLPFDRVYDYISSFEAKDLVRLEFAAMSRHRVVRRARAEV